MSRLAGVTRGDDGSIAKLGSRRCTALLSRTLNGEKAASEQFEGEQVVRCKRAEGGGPGGSISLRRSAHVLPPPDQIWKGRGARRAVSRVVRTTMISMWRHDLA